MSSTAICASCLTNKANLTCAGCSEALCKTCAQFVDEESFAFYPKRPDGIEIGAYCPQCYAAKVADEQAKYNDIKTRAGDVLIYLINQTQESRLLPRRERKLTVTGAHGQDEAILNLAFQALQRGMNCLVDVTITTTKVRDAGHQHVLFNGTAIPTMRPARWKRL